MKILSIKKYIRSKLNGFGWLANDFNRYEIIVDDNGEVKAYNGNLELLSKGMLQRGSIEMNISLGSGYTSWSFEKELTIDQLKEISNNNLIFNGIKIDERP